jgi:hypothetical protein
LLKGLAMNDRVLVRSTMRTWDFTLLLIAGIVLLVGAAVAAGFGRVLVAAPLGLAGCGCVLGAVLGQRRRVQRRQWVQDLGDGFLVIDQAGERRFADDDVLSMALTRKNNYVNGLLTSETRRLLVWLTSDEPVPEGLEMVNTVKTGTVDPLAGLINRLGDLLFRRAGDDLAAGQAVLGEGWTLQNDVLTLRTQGAEVSCPVAELAAVDFVDADICLWRTGQDEAFARVPKKSANAYILSRLLATRLAERPTPAPPPESTGLGRVIFERRPRRGTVVVLVVLGLVFLFVAAIAWLGGGLDALHWGIGALVLGGCFLGGALHAARTILRCHQFGVTKRGLFGERSLRYADVAVFSYSAVRHFHNGAYTGTIFRLGFEPVPERARDRITHSVTLPHADQELEGLRDQVSRMIAARMARQLAAGEPVRWTPHLRFVPDGVEYRPAGFFGRKEPVLVPFREIYSYQIHQGTFFLWAKGQKKAVVREAMTQRNFFPGFYLLAGTVPLAQPGASGAVQPGS